MGNAAGTSKCGACREKEERKGSDVRRMVVSGNKGPNHWEDISQGIAVHC